MSDDPDLVAILRKGLADESVTSWIAGEMHLMTVENDEWEPCADLILAVFDALPGLLDEIEAARALLEFVGLGDWGDISPGASDEDTIRWSALTAAYIRARAANEGRPA